MQIVYLSKEEIKVIPEVVEDLWVLERVIEEDDVIFAKSFRKFKIDEEESGEKKIVNIEIRAEKIEFHKHINNLRVTGKIIRGTPEKYVQIGSYHTINIKLNRPVVIKKEWNSYQITILKKAQKNTEKPIVRILLLDEKKALFALLKSYGVEFDFEISSGISKRDKKVEEKIKEYFGNIVKKLKENKIDKIIIGGPGFTKENFYEFVKIESPELLQKAVLASCSSVEQSGVYELLKKGVISKIIGEEKIEREFMLMEEFLKELSKESGLVVYGFDEVKKALEYGAIRELLVLDELVRKKKEVREILEKTEKKGAMITIFTEENVSKQLESFGGIGGILRFKIS